MVCLGSGEDMHWYVTPIPPVLSLILCSGRTIGALPQVSSVLCLNVFSRTATTIDNKRSAQFEELLLITETGCEVLTAGGAQPFEGVP